MKRPEPRPTQDGKRANGSSIVDVSKRYIELKTRLLLWVRAGGRCEFDGCNAYLLEHHLTRSSGIYGQAAHIVAFSIQGPRGRNRSRPASINDVENLMLLCPACHKQIDDHLKQFPVETLREYKHRHESRIVQLTDLGPEGRTAVLILLAPVRGHSVSVPFEDIVKATAPRYPAKREPRTIDLTTVSDDGSAFLQAACDTIKQDTEEFFGRHGEATKIGHVSVFALAPIPLLVYLGHQMTSKIPADLYQRHRGQENWLWKKGGPRVGYSVRRVSRGAQRGKVALILSLSGRIRLSDIPKPVRERSSIYMITLSDQTPRTTFLQTRQDLEGFRVAYQEVLGLILQENDHVSAIELFPAIPAPIAVLCGRELLPKVHPRLRIWDFDRAKGGFTYQMEV